MSRDTILIADPVAEVCAEIFRRAGWEVVRRDAGTTGDLTAALKEAVGLVVRSETKVTEALLDAGARLRVVGRAGTGVDNIDVAAATRRGVVVMNAPGENTIAAAEHTLSLMLALARNIPAADRSIKAGRWERGRFMGVELYGKTLGVIGLGKVGREVAARARAFGMEVRGFDPFLPEEVSSRLGFTMLPLPDLLAVSDFLTLHVPLNDQTRHLLGAETLQRCKPGIRIVNCARGGIVDEAALARALDQGKVAGAALDVFEKEPPASSHPLAARDEVVATPHLGASTVEAQEKVAVRIAEQMIAYLQRGSVAGAVNADAIEPEVFRVIAPWIELSEKLGRFQARLAPAAARDLTVELSGALLEHPVTLLVAAVLKGFLEGVVTQPVNLINAPLLAREMGIRVQEVRASDPSDYTSLVATRVTTASGDRTIAGTLFGKHEARLVRLDEFRFDAVPAGEMLICSNDDRPGMVGVLGTLLGQAAINIASLSLGRDHTGGKAIAIFNLDSPVSPDLLERIRSLSGILWAESVRL
ncbi:MAG TPA: phosphoglycerate dehydrogenase [Candidatus Polarisedimenticolia bacterium]|nr:phosphoglycerate dehydrogenase [Candidatus Polarisedimenticolia bacterium]